VYPVAPVLSLGARCRGYDFEVEVLVLAGRAGLPLASTPIRVRYPPANERVSHFHLFWDNVRISWLHTRLLGGVWLWPLGWPARLSRAHPPLARSRRWSGRSRGGALGHLIFFAVLKALGRRPADLLLYPVVLYFMVAAPRALRASRAFLDVACGPAAGPWQRFARSYRHFLTFAQCLVDRAQVQLSGARGFVWRSEGDEALDEGGLIVSAHLGNYELGGALLELTGRPLHVVMVDAEAEAIKRVRQQFGTPRQAPRVIAVNHGGLPALSILAVLRSGERVAMHGDRIIDEHWVWCDFFGKPAPFPTGVFFIAAAARKPLVLAFGFREGRGRYRFVAEPPRRIELPPARRQAALLEHVRWYASRLEHYARLYPLHWFNFYDFWAVP
jgi:predicted LPLAT superfamily acyltransferase